MAGIAVVTVWLVQRYLGSLARFARFVGELSDEREPVMPRLSFAPATEELATAAATLSAGWRRQRASIDNLAASAQAIVDGLPDPLIAVDRQRRIVRTNLRGARPARRRSAPSATSRRCCAIRSSWPRSTACSRPADGNFTGPDQTGVEFVLPGPPELDMVAHLRRLPRAAADGSLALIVLHDTHGAAPRRAHARRLRRQCEPRAQDADRGPRRLHRDPARPGARRCAARERFLGIMAEQAERMRRLVDDLLMLSRIEQHEHARPDAEHRPRPRARRACSTCCSSRPPRARWRSSSTSRRGLPRAVGDYDELTIVFQNLVDNAIKYAKPNTRCAWRRAGRWVAIRVAVAVRTRATASRPTTCRGSPSASTASTPRARASSAAPGSGLAIVKHVVNRHRGRLDIQSTPGKGSTFTVILPAA